jgi:RecA-family ATPase
MIDVQAAAQALGGEVSGTARVLCPGPGHSPKDRSLSVNFAPESAELDFVVKSFSPADDPIVCRDYVQERLGLPAWQPGRPSRRIVAEYDYTDETGELLFQAIRMKPKAFRQRQRDVRVPGGWAWNIKGVRLVPYNLPAVIEAVATSRQVCIVEGEKDADSLNALGFVATCNPMGAGKWRDVYAEHFTGADVIILPDNDKAGLDHAETVARSLAGEAFRVRVVALPDVPPKGDISDWLNAGGNVEALNTLAAATEDWGHTNVEAKASEIEWFDDIAPVLALPYLIKGLLDRGTMSVLYGPSNSGKTFFAMDLAYHVAVGQEWRDRRIVPGAVLYLAAEGGNGAANRIAGLRQHFGAKGVPLALRRAGLDLLDPNADTEHVITIASDISARQPIVLIVIDTLSRVLAGGDENGPVDMTAFVKNVDRIRHATGAHVLVVHHTGKDTAKGARGHSSLRAATDTEIEISEGEAGIRLAATTKQRDYAGGENFHFSLETIELGQDQDGDAVNTCIVTATERPESDDFTPSMQTCRAMQKDIEEGWDTGNPLTMARRNKNTERYAPRFFAGKYGLRPVVLENLMTKWIDNELIRTDTFDTRNKRTGLRIQKWL